MRQSNIWKIHGYNFPKFRKDIKLQINKALLTLSRIIKRNKSPGTL